MNIRLSVLLVPLLVPPAASAHHSFAPHFDVDKPANITGKVIEYEARNPHSYLHIAAVDENGKTQEYVCESHGVTVLARVGLTAAVLQPGTELRVDGSLSRHSPYMCFFNNVYFPDGRTFNVNGGRGGQAVSAAVTALPPRTDIFGTWMLAPGAPDPRRTNTSRPQPMLNFLTPAGQAAVAAYDPFTDDPTFRCDPVAVRRVWGAPTTPLAIVRAEDTVLLRHEWMDVVRTVHLNMREHPADGPRTSLGHAIGHFDGDTLVIETANYSAGVLSQYVEEPGKPTRGMLHSAALTSVERLSFDAARQRLVVDVWLKDPEFFTRDFDVARLEYAPSDLAIEPFNCTPEGVTGTIEQ
jgi:hypothetical protein